MQIQVNTDHNIPGHEALVTEVEASVLSSLQRFGKQITRVEVHLTDENGNKGGADDKRCVLEARLEGHQPLVVTHQAETLKQAYVGAAHKMKTALTTTVEKLRAY
ncbi:MAG: HPF/RaiA family ribosome-associated protein [Phycisphaerae bacterium]|nr:HPF/RaiA family ribosome-associated protein [Gemmatimonadaceae bacterium]